MAPRKTKTADQDEYTSGRRVDRTDSGEDPTTGDIKDSESPLDEDDPMDDDENITGDEELYDRVENEDPAVGRLLHGEHRVEEKMPGGGETALEIGGAVDAIVLRAGEDEVRSHDALGERAVLRVKGVE